VVFGIIFVLSISAIIFFFIRFLSKLFNVSIPAFYFNKVVFKNNIDRKQYKEIDEILIKYFPYYQALSLEGKAHFIHKTLDFIYNKQIIGRSKLIITNEIQFCIGGCAAQITFGLKNSDFSKFKLINVFPEAFRTPSVKNKIKGGASVNGTLYFSWKDLQSGLLHLTDNINLGLHEMAHALKINNVLLGKYDLLDDFDLHLDAYIYKWEQISQQKFEKLKSGNAEYLRPYGGTNKEEFFAVCVEHFFETPHLFSKKLPEIYHHFCILLNQNPLHTTTDYRL
jgi:MtfA peptidase